MQAPGFWDDQERAAKVSAEHASVQRKLTAYRELEQELDDIEALEELAQEDESITGELDEQRELFASKLAELEEAGQIVLRYAAGANPNGAVADVAGVLNAEGNVFGLMPHPEHAVDPLLGSTDGALILGSLVDAARLSAAALV